jgi:5-(carboxyamino)imidazole ribonucleotide mutase
MLATTDPALAGRLDAWRARQTEAVAAEPVDPPPADQGATQGAIQRATGR